MNLNRLKRGFTRTDPERGLRNLPGATKSDRMDDSLSTIRVKGRYIPTNTDRAGQLFGMMGYIHSWLYLVLLSCTVFATNTLEFSPLSIFLIGFAVVHGCAMAADGLRHSEAPWARKGIKIFWLTTLAFSVYGIVVSTMG